MNGDPPVRSDCYCVQIGKSDGCFLCGGKGWVVAPPKPDQPRKPKPVPVLTHKADDTPEAKAIETEFAPGVWDTATDYGPRECDARSETGADWRCEHPLGHEGAHLFSDSSVEVVTEADLEKLAPLPAGMEPAKPMTRTEHVAMRGGKDRKMSKHDGTYISEWSKKAEIHVAKALGVYNDENKARIEALGADKGTDIVYRGWKIDVKWSPTSGEQYGDTAGGFVFDEDVIETPDMYVFVTTEGMVIRGWQWQKPVRALPSRVWSTEKDVASHKVDYITLRAIDELEKGRSKG